MSSSPHRRRLLLLPLLVAAAALWGPLPAGAGEATCKAWLVQSIPTDMPQLRRVPGVLSTGDVLQWLSGNATKSLDILAQYWQFLAQPNNPKSGDYGFTDSDMKRFGADEGRRVYKALENAADRRPNVQNATLLFENWWGSGVVHAKVWISDKKDVSPIPLSVDIPYTVGYPELANPEMIDVPFETPGSKKSTQEHYLSYLSFAPPEVTFDKFQADEQGWVETIKSVKVGGIVRMNTMDWLGQSQYATETVYWPALSSAISEVVFSKNATVRLLVAYWTHFIPNTEKYLKSLLYSNILCASSKYNHCGGKVEIKYYIVPGYNNTGPALSQGGAATGNLYPDFTRVNHGKYAVSDVRANISTSNLIWDYFYTTAGVSFGTYNPSIVSQLQDIFDADWYSPYTVPVKPLESSV
nr:unnamed protein product [Digitaria exilis]